MREWITTPILAVLLGGCSLAPKYSRPEAPVANTFVDGDGDSSDVVEVSWRDVLVNETLRQVVETALENNRDLRVAALNVEAARARYRIERADLAPQVDGSASATRTKTSRETFRGSGATFNEFDVGLGASYELDLFGSVKNLKRQAWESYAALTETQRAAQIALVAEVAAQYLTLEEYRAQRKLARDTLDSLEATYNLTQLRATVGVAAEDDLASVNVQTQTAEVQARSYDLLVVQTQNSLQTLVGAPLPALPESEGKGIDDRLLADLPSGLPSDLIARRPDVLAAEHALIAANANIGVARAAFFPRISLTGDAGFASQDLQNLFTPGATTWSFGPKLSVPIFAGGRNRANLKLAKIQKRIEVARYEQVVQTAFREVSDALVARQSLVGQLQARHALIASQQQRFDLATSKYQAGIGSYLEVLTAQQGLFQAQSAVITAEFVELRNLVALYEALGGGWSAEDVPVVTEDDAKKSRQKRHERPGESPRG